MDKFTNCPLDEIGKLGEMLIRNSIEKEYFLYVQEKCRLKWQATAGQLAKLSKEHEKCILEKEQLKRNVEHISQLWEREKEILRTTEKELKYYKLMRSQIDCPKNHIDDLTDSHDQDENELNENINIVGESNAEITSTESFLSDLLNTSSQVDDDCVQLGNEMLKKRQNSMEFNDVFLDMKSNKPCALNNSMLEKTFWVRSSSNNEIDEIVGGLSDSEYEDEQDVQNPPRNGDIYACVSDKKSRLTIEPITTVEIHPDPIYESIKDSNNSISTNNKENTQKAIDVFMSCNTDLLYADPNIKLQPSPNNCQHSFSHRTASRSVVCFLCLKKFRFGILAYKCSNCSAFVHHDCKSQLKPKYLISDFAPEFGHSVPPLIVHCVDQIESRGLSERGIYRVSGSEKEVKALKERFMQNNGLPNLTNVDIHVICGCIKIFLRTLREPLIPTYLWSVFSNIVNGDSNEKKIQNRLQFEISHLPKANRDTLAFLVMHLQRVATCPEVQMPTTNLAKIFGPTVVGYSKQEPDHAAILGETFIQQDVMLHFLNISNDFWFDLWMLTTQLEEEA